MESKFREHQIIPDLLSEAPDHLVSVKYGLRGTTEVFFGNELTPTQTCDPPTTIFYPSEDKKFYTLSFLDPDVPSREHPKYRSWQLWQVVNIPGCDVSKGEVLSEYIGPCPPRDSGKHRFVFLVFEQPEHMQFTERRLDNRSADYRGDFDVGYFAQVYNLGKPHAANFFYAEYDSTVKLIFKRLTEIVEDPMLNESHWTG